jgi:hypothetical protein
MDDTRENAYRSEMVVSPRTARVSAQGAFPMFKTVLTAALAAALVAALAPATLATPEMKIAEAAVNPTTQQQKMKDCNEKWKEERANTGAKGGTAYRKFLSACLKKTPA